MADFGRVRSRAGLARRGRTGDRGPETEYLAFRLGDDVYAGAVTFIQEILKPPPLTPVPRAPFSIMGIVSVRGQLVTVIDLRRRLRLPEEGPTRRARVLLVKAATEGAGASAKARLQAASGTLVSGPGEEMLGLYVDEVLQVYRLADSEIEQASAALGGEVAPYISGIARPLVTASSSSSVAQADASLVILLDLRSLLAT
jgi:purine-binding chemotaxis protein CheW